MQAIASIIALGSDGFLASLAIGTLAMPWRARVRLAAAFGVSDALGTWLGALLQHGLPEPPALAVWLVCSLILGVAARSSHRILYALPVLLGLDNLFAGTSPDLAPALGASSALMAMAGLSLGGACRHLALNRRAAV
jgi:hypothetical protein